MKLNISNQLSSKKTLLALTMCAVLVFSGVVVSKDIQKAKAATKTVSTATELKSALDSFDDGDVIQLSSDIDYNVTGEQKAFKIQGKQLTIDLNNHVLNYNYNPNINYLESYAIIVREPGSELKIQGNGSFNISSISGAIVAYNHAKATVTNVNVSVPSDGGVGVSANTYSQLTVLGNLVTDYGTNLIVKNNSVANVRGNVTGGDVGVDVSAGSSAYIEGQISTSVTNSTGGLVRSNSVLKVDGGIVSPVWANIDSQVVTDSMFITPSSLEGYKEYKVDTSAISKLFVRDASYSPPPPGIATSGTPRISTNSGEPKLVNSSIAYITGVDYINHDGLPIDEIGVVYSKNRDMSEQKSVKTDSTNPDSIVALDNLDSGTDYYYSGYVDSSGTRYTGSVQKFTTMPGPKVITGTASNVTPTSADIINNSFDSTGYQLQPTAIGINYSTTPDFSGEIYWTSSNNYDSPFSATLTKLKPNTQYWFEAYINEASTGNQYRGIRGTFTTPPETGTEK